MELEPMMFCCRCREGMEIALLQFAASRKGKGIHWRQESARSKGGMDWQLGFEDWRSKG
uniref:Uncharacterized protein n=1 Tax=Arundo donax TaxID=35708 RepID=A0A0A9FD00_ARUDO